MRQLSGKPISAGYARGLAYVCNPAAGCEVPRYEISGTDVPEEQRRFHAAVIRSFDELKQLEKRVMRQLGEAQSAIFAAHLGLLQDQYFVQRIKARIERDLVNVEHALDQEVAALCEALACVENEYIRERAQDVRDVGQRVMRHLAAPDSGIYFDLPPQSVIVARELLPSQTLDLDRNHIRALVTELGGENSHAAILARGLGIPAVSGISLKELAITTGMELLVDGERGWVCVEPSEQTLAEFTLRKTSYDNATATAVAAESLACVTEDGTRIQLLANINRPHEAAQVAPHHLEGVGLFRTEFMFLDSAEPPDLERQRQAYQRVFQATPSGPVVIRTLDFSADKVPIFLRSSSAVDPHFGARGVRFSLTEGDLFETQTRAILTAAAERQREVRILIPMILSAADVDTAAEAIGRYANELAVENLVQVGAMIETPAALFALEEIAERADFLCIGTNDLTQFMLAVDRNASGRADNYSVLHASILRAIKKIVQTAAAKKREVCVCGEAASYPRTAALLIGLGVRQLSMSPLRAARVRYQLRASRLSDLEEVAQQALKCRSTAEVRHLVRQIPSRLSGDGTTAARSATAASAPA